MYSLMLSCCLTATGIRAGESDPPELTEEELEAYQFGTRQDEIPAVVTDLSVGQKFLLNRHRQEINNLVARHLGILKLRQDKSDLAFMQQLIDRKVIRSSEVRKWQELGVAFGDILVTELDLHWVSYEDDLGVSKALRWRETENYVFPVTLFSKRVQFNEKIDVISLYDQLEMDIERFKAYERGRPEFRQGASREKAI